MNYKYYRNLEKKNKLKENEKLDDFKQILKESSHNKIEEDKLDIKNILKRKDVIFYLVSCILAIILVAYVIYKHII